MERMKGTFYAIIVLWKKTQHTHNNRSVAILVGYGIDCKNGIARSLHCIYRNNNNTNNNSTNYKISDK